ncbi:hypothetical protein BGW42_004688 [Actinomortierella wolfii]|nr:hypothetical protein BGW42_004688 [Actinomortierella wolfii]
MAPLPISSSLSSPSSRGGTPAGPRPIYKAAIAVLVATTALLLLINTSQPELTWEQDRAPDQHSQQHTPPSHVSAPHYPIQHLSQGQGGPVSDVSRKMEQDQDNENSDDEYWRFDDVTTVEEQAEEDDTTEIQQHKYLPILPSHYPHWHRPQDEEDNDSLDILPSGCPALFFRTKPSPISFASSSTSWPTIMDASQVNCESIPSLLKDFSLAFCISKADCSRGFIQVVRQIPSGVVSEHKVSKNPEHNRYFNEVAGPDDFYFLVEGSQRLALSAKRYHGGAINVSTTASQEQKTKKNAARQDSSQNQQTTETSSLVYRADFRMTLPGPLRLSAWHTYENFRAVRENQPGVWPQWSHTPLVPERTEIGTICPSCELDSFVETISKYRQTHFEPCDRMAPVRGAYWREDLAAKVYRANQDSYNTGPGAGAELEPQEDEENDNSDDAKPKKYRHLTKGWRFVPQGCTMTKTEKQTVAPSSQQPLTPSCDSIETRTGGSIDREAEKSKGHVLQPVRNILFTGDSQVRTTYNMILGYYRPFELERMKFSTHTEYISITGSYKHVVRLEYKADQFLLELINYTDEVLDKYDTIYLNIGQWPASGPFAGGQWSTEQLMNRWQRAIDRLTRWRDSRSAKGLGGSRVIWAGQNAFPMRTDHQIRTKVDWRTNARLGYWDDLMEHMAQQAGGWFRRLNAWALTFPILDEIVDRAHFQETDAIDAIRLEALYKLDLCSSVVQDKPYDGKSSSREKSSMK